MKLKRNHNGEQPGGFSLIELMIVVAIVLVIAAVAIPNFVTVVANARMRSGMSSLGGLIQQCRAVGIRNNANTSVHFTVMAAGPVAFIKDATLTGAAAAITATDPQVQLGAPVSKVTALTGPGAPGTPLDNTILGFTPQTGDPSFNPRGLPCNWTGATCTTGVGFVYYFTDARPLGNNGWAAVTISPAGRVKVWTWNGASWN